MSDLEERVRSLAEPVLARHGAELVDLQVKRGRTQLVRVVADRPGGIDVETCARVSEDLSRMLDVDDPLTGRYTLEVTSPGLDRLLRSPDDFRRTMGRRVRIVLSDRQHEGVVEEVGDTSVRLRTGGMGKPGHEVAGGSVEIPLAEVASARIVLPW